MSRWRSTSRERGMNNFARPKNRDGLRLQTHQGRPGPPMTELNPLPTPRGFGRVVHFPSSALGYVNAVH